MAKHKYIETPEKLYEYFTQYKEWVKENPITIEDYVGKNAIRVMREKPRCLTIEGFENYLYDKSIIGDLSHYFANTNDSYTDYLTICSRIKKEVRQNQIEGGMAGIYNPSITQRLNGLIDKKETEIKGGLNIPNLPDIGNRK